MPEQEQKVQRKPVQEEHETLVRILTYDIPGSKNIHVGLTRVKGVSWTISNALCKILGLDKTKKVSDLSKADIERIESFLINLHTHSSKEESAKIPDFLKNRRADPETGATVHLFGTDLDMKKEFDIKRLKKIKSYKGVRHSAKQPVRGQRTRSHFRERGKAVGVKKKAK